MNYYPIEEEEKNNEEPVLLGMNPLEMDKMCRICLEEDNIDNFFAPCLCKGTSKWVHRECLNQWRATSTNSLAFHKCMECHYDYRMNEIHLPYNFLRDCNIYLARHTFFFFFINQFIILGFSLLVKALDSEHQIPQIFNESNDLFAYYLLTTLVYISLLFIGFSLNFASLRNKQLYCGYYSKINKIHAFLSIVTVIFIIICLPVLGILFFTLLIQTFIKYHYQIIDKLDKANNMEILEFSEETRTDRGLENTVDAETKEAATKNSNETFDDFVNTETNEITQPISITQPINITQPIDIVDAKLPDIRGLKLLLV